MPVELRREFGLAPGDPLIARAVGQRLVLERRDAVLQRLQDRFAGITPGVSLVDELIEKRRREAELERG